MAKATTKKTSKTAAPSSQVWEKLHGKYMAALRAGEDLTKHRAAIHRFDRKMGWPLSQWV